MPRTVSLSPRGYPSESLAKANSRPKVISVYGARLISYRSRIFIAADTRVCARMRGPTRGCDREIEYDRKGGKTQWPRYFAEGLKPTGRRRSGCELSATAHTPCFINCGLGPRTQGRNRYSPILYNNPGVLFYPRGNLRRIFI